MTLSNSLFIYPWDEASKGADLLKDALGIRRIMHRNSAFKGSSDKTVINWGSGSLPVEVEKSKVLNSAKAVNRSSDKIVFFSIMKNNGGGRIPGFTTSKDEVMEWLRKGNLVVARNKIRSKGGKGIVFFDNLTEFVTAPLYTVYIKKREEYRVHFMRDKVIDIQKKALRKTDDEGNPIDPKQVDWRIRNHSNGFIFVRGNLRIPEDVVKQSMLCAKASGLDFGAVDVVWNETQGKAYVLEINTAPGIEGVTVDSYAKAFRELVGV